MHHSWCFDFSSHCVNGVNIYALVIALDFLQRRQTIISSDYLLSNKRVASRRRIFAMNHLITRITG